MELSRKERLILYNQYRILENVDAENKDAYRAAQEVLAQGFAYHYSGLAEDIEEDTLSAEECREVLDILSMFRALKFSGHAPADVHPEDMEFSGFDVNEETKQYVYANFYMGVWNKFPELHDAQGGCPNSHRNTLPEYRKMLAEWQASENKHKLTEDDVRRIARARSPWRYKA